MEQYLLDSPLSELFPEGVVTVMSDGVGDIGELYEEERVMVAKAVDKRKREFSAGRLCAKQALEVLGIENFPIVSGEGRNPVFPEGIRASISHAKGCCGVAAFKSANGGLIGLDIEECDRLRADLWPMTLVEEEIALINNDVRLASVIFSAKEAFYKYQYPLTKEWVGFKDACVSVNTETGEFSLKLLKDLSPYWGEGAEFRGKYVFFENYVAAGLCLLEGI